VTHPKLDKIFILFMAGFPLYHVLCIIISLEKGKVFDHVICQSIYSFKGKKNNLESHPLLSHKKNLFTSKFNKLKTPTNLKNLGLGNNHDLMQHT